MYSVSSDGLSLFGHIIAVVTGLFSRIIKSQSSTPTKYFRQGNNELLNCIKPLTTLARESLWCPSEQQQAQKWTSLM